MRDVATALGDPERKSETRAILREKLVWTRADGLKSLLASAPRCQSILIALVTLGVILTCQLSSVCQKTPRQSPISQTFIIFY